jgi:hypothetical protein
MATIALNIPPVKVGDIEVTIVLVAPEGGTSEVTEYNIPVIRFTNTDIAAHPITIWNVPPGATGPSSDNLELFEVVVLAKSTLEFGPLTLFEGREIVAVTDAADVFVAQVHGWKSNTAP